MIIQNKFIKLDYNPKMDVLFVDWPNIHDYTVPELRHILEEMVDTVRHYDIKKILVDSRKSAITLADASYADIISKLALDLKDTRLEKFARLQTQETNREKIASDAASLVQGSIQYRTFADASEALEWLSA